MTHAGHLVRRFLGSLRPGGPPPADEAWARDALLAGERVLWDRMSGPDRRHAVGVARRTEAALGHKATRPVVAAALLHDVGKIESGFGTFGRVAATLVAAMVGRKRLARRKGRLGRYVRHDALGGELLEAAGSHTLTRTWAREHHLPEDRWTLDPEIGAALKAADDD
jgi:CRISPR-associated nuclease/helicase Cas3-like protein